MQNRVHLKIVTVLIPIIFLIFILLKDYLMWFLTLLPACPFLTILHIYCPACGNTRSVEALLKGNLSASLHFNIIPFLLLLLCFFAYIELAAYSFARPVRLLPRKLSFYLVLIALLAVYMILRNFIPTLAP